METAKQTEKTDVQAVGGEVKHEVRHTTFTHTKHCRTTHAMHDMANYIKFEVLNVSLFGPCTTVHRTSETPPSIEGAPRANL